ncbi:MAG TPA: dihydroneopterin aldolase [Longimicrobiales bacterium]|nr:dihydroneopterin aldolase [Longimicrobiales bacterium]
MTDRIVVPGLPLRARVGVSDEERASEQDLVLDVELRLDLGPAGRTDALAATVDYEEVCRTLAGVVASRPFRLVEAVAEASACALLEAFPARAVRVRVRKPGALRAWGVPYAAVEVRRRRRDA